MSGSLSDALIDFSRDWRDDLSPSWAATLAHVEPAPDQVLPSLTILPEETIFPGRKSHPVAGAPSGSHVFRALDRLAPAQVKAVIIGQDPYPRKSRATGRAFDQGDLTAWRPSTTNSLRKIVQAVAYERTQDPEYLTGTGWSLVLARLKNDSLTLPAPTALFDHWESQGVLLLNAGLTLSRFQQGAGPEQKFGHIPFWSPLIVAILRALAERPTGHVAYLTWGEFAKNVVLGAQLTTLPSWGTRAFMVSHAHPAAPKGFLTTPGPFTKANEELTARGGAAIDW